MTGHKIVVIDDSKVIRMRVRDMLPEGNFEVLEAKDGVEGLNLIRQERPNLIMLDFLLPRMSGWEVYQELQQQRDLQKIPLVIMSGRKEEVTDKLQEPFEYFEFIEKPFEKDQLQQAIRSAFAKSKLSRLDAPEATEDSAELAALKQKVEHMEAEIAALKKAVSQLVALIKRKLP
uniref:Response regulator receiver protein n=1 Tax=Cyanothece sp. (strain PCC 7425 / ATCC 29141) TaxID=395961 RepID=B8HYN0_CYAP4